MTSRSLKLKSSDGKIFNTMLDSLGGDSDTDEDEIIPIYTINGEILQKIVRWTRHFLYNNSFKSDFKCWSDQFFLTNLENTFQIAEGADYLEINSLLEECQDFIDEHFKELTATKGFKNLSQQKLISLLARDSLNVPNEEVVFQSLMSWLSADPEERTKYLEDLIPQIRAHFLSEQFLCEKLKNPDLSHQLNYENRTPRSAYEHCIIVLHENKGFRQLKHLDTKTETWTQLTVVPDEFYRHGCKLCCVEDDIYLVGPDSRVTAFNTSTRTWRDVARMKVRSNGANVCSLGSKIFVMHSVLF